MSREADHLGSDARTLVFDALVVGRTLPTLLAALDLAEVGLRVALAGGATQLPDGAERDSTGALREALERIAAPIEGSGAAVDEGALPVSTPPVAPWLLDDAGDWAPQFAPSVWGIPAVPLSAVATRFLGSRGSMRAHLDRLMPLLKMGGTITLGELVRRRVGTAVLDRMTEPLVQEAFGVPAAQVDVFVAAPGLTTAFSRTGALTTAVLAYAERNVARETSVEPAAGWLAFEQSLRQRLRAYGVESLDAAAISASSGSSERADGGGAAWSVELADGTRVDTRALLVDPGRMPTDGLISDPLRAFTSDLLPSRTRVHAEIDIHAPDALAECDAGAAVRLLGDWVLRVENCQMVADGAVSGSPSGTSNAADARRWRAHLSGPAVHTEAASLAGQPGVNEPTDPVGQTEAQYADLLRSAGYEVADAADWRVRRVPAPFATVAQRDRAAAAIVERTAEHPGLLPLGRALHGDDLSAALVAAHGAAVTLRRELLGLNEAPQAAE